MPLKFGEVKEYSFDPLCGDSEISLSNGKKIPMSSQTFYVGLWGQDNKAFAYVRKVDPINPGEYICTGIHEIAPEVLGELENQLKKLSEQNAN